MKLPTHIFEGKKRPEVPRQAAKLATEAGIILRRHIPVLPRWNKLQHEQDHLSNYIKKVFVQFSMDTTSEPVISACADMLKSGQRQMRYKLKKKYFDNVPESQRITKSPVSSTDDNQWEELLKLWSSPQHMLRKDLSTRESKIKEKEDALALSEKRVVDLSVEKETLVKSTEDFKAKVASLEKQLEDLDSSLAKALETNKVLRGKVETADQEAASFAKAEELRLSSLCSHIQDALISRDKFKDADPTAVDLFREFHSSQKTGSVSETVQKALDDMEAMMEEPVREGEEPMSPGRAVCEVVRASTFLEVVGLKSKKKLRVPVCSRLEALIAELEREKAEGRQVEQIVEQQRREIDALRKQVQEARDSNRTVEAQLEHLRKESAQKASMIACLMSNFKGGQVHPSSLTFE
ncbi:hypothetical protein EJB05_50235, partial [Eragrostis curvula]